MSVWGLHAVQGRAGVRVYLPSWRVHTVAAGTIKSLDPILDQIVGSFDPLDRVTSTGSYMCVHSGVPHI